MDYSCNTTFEAAARFLAQAPRTLVLTHAKPDGDAFGGVVALVAALREMGREARGLVVPPIPAAFQTLRGAELCEIYRQGTSLDPQAAVVLVDTGAWAQLGPIKEVLTPALERTLIVDHHLSGDVPAKLRLIDGKAAASCEVAARLIEALQALAPAGVSLMTRTVCDALFVGIASDTGWFRFSNTKAETHELAARLIRAGVDATELYRLTEQTERPEKLALLIRALDSMTLEADGRAAVMVLRAKDFLETGAVLEETERFVDIPQAVAQVQMVVLVTETPPHGAKGVSAAQCAKKRWCGASGVEGASPSAEHTGRPKMGDVGAPSPGNAGDGKPLTRLSFRSKPGPHAVDVAKFAGKWGGGGHARAAGAKVPRALDEVLAEVKNALNEAFAK